MEYVRWNLCYGRRCPHNDLGVQCYINPDQDILTTNRLDITLKVKPYGYAKYIEVELGFLVES